MRRYTKDFWEGIEEGVTIRTIDRAGELYYEAAEEFNYELIIEPFEIYIYDEGQQIAIVEYSINDYNLSSSQIDWSPEGKDVRDFIDDRNILDRFLKVAEETFGRNAVELVEFDYRKVLLRVSVIQKEVRKSFIW